MWEMCEAFCCVLYNKNWDLSETVYSPNVCDFLQLSWISQEVAFLQRILQLLSKGFHRINSLEDVHLECYFTSTVSLRITSVCFM